MQKDPNKKKEKEEEDIKEASVVGGIKGFSQPFGLSKRKNASGGSKKNNVSKPFGESELFENALIQFLLNNIEEEEELPEVVRKVGSQWHIFDDETEVEKGSFPTRSQAWEKQRQYRRSQQANILRKQREKERKRRAGAPEVEKKPGIKRSPGSVAVKKHRLPPKKRYTGADFHRPISGQQRKENKQEFLKRIFKESFVSYIFEQQPKDEQTLMWDKFVKHLSSETVMSDPKFKDLLSKMASVETKLLSKASSEVKNALNNEQSFEVKQTKAEKDPETKQVKHILDVHLKDNNKVYKISIKVENGRPLIHIPDAANTEMNQMANDEIKLFKGVLIYLQESVLDQMNDVMVAAEKRDKYNELLSKIEERLILTEETLDQKMKFSLATVSNKVKTTISLLILLT